MIVLAVIALIAIGSIALIVSGLSKLFGSRPDSGGTHITYNVTISKSFNGRTDDHGSNETKTARSLSELDEFKLFDTDGDRTKLFNRTNRY